VASQKGNNMGIIRPQISEELLEIENFSSYAQDYLAEETPINEIKSCQEQIEGAEFVKIEVQRSIFEHNTFHNCNFDKASFVDVVFQSCDFSNSKFVGAYFNRCRFISCKGIGIDMSETVVKQTTFEESNFQYAYFYKTKMTDVLFDHLDFTEASMIEAKLNKFAATDSKFVRNNFSKTMLVKVDFSNNELVAPIVSNPPVELKGAIINIYQAVDLIGLWGVIVKQ